MRRAVALVSAAAAVALAAPCAWADWAHAVKWDQLDNPSNWNVASMVTDDGQTISADDFLCTETGYITDIEFWGGYSDIFALNALRITFWDDVPATDTDEGRPGRLLREIVVTEACPCDPYRRGWQLADGDRFKINLYEYDWFRQEAGIIYWIGIQGLMDGDALFVWYLRDPSVPTQGDDAAWASDDQGLDTWWHVGWPTDAAPSTYTGTLPGDWLRSADLCFRLTGTPIPEPASAGLACLIGLILVKRGKR